MKNQKILLSSFLIALSTNCINDNTIIQKFLTLKYWFKQLTQKKEDNNLVFYSSVPTPAPAPAPIPTYNLYEAKEFIRTELQRLNDDIQCGRYYAEPSAGCVITLQHKVTLHYMQKNIDKNPTLLMQELEKYMKEQIKNLNDSYYNPYFQEIEPYTNDWFDETGLYGYKNKHIKTIERLKRYYRKIYNKNI